MAHPPSHTCSHFRPSHDPSAPQPTEKSNFAGLSWKQRIIHVEKRRHLTVEAAGGRGRFDQRHNTIRTDQWTLMQQLRTKPRRFYRRVPSLTRILPYFYNAAPSFPPCCRTKRMQVNDPTLQQATASDRLSVRLERRVSAGKTSFCRLPKWWNGRHARLRGVWRKPCGFKSRLRHQLSRNSAPKA